MIAQVAQDIKENKIRGLYYFYGDEKYLADYYLQKIEEQVIPEKIDGINYEHYSYRDMGLSALVAAANTMSFMGDKKLIVVRDAELLSKEKMISAQALATFENYLKEPNPSTVMVFLGETEAKALAKNKVANAIKKSSSARLIQAGKLKGAELKRWVREEVSHKGLSASPDVIERLVLIAEKGLYNLQNELEKIAVGNDTGVITKEDADSVISYTPEGKIFELVDAVITKNGKKALHLLDEYLGAGEPEYMLRAMLISSFRRLLIIKDALAAGYMKPVFRTYLDTSSDFLIDKSVRQVQKITASELEAVYRELYELEFLSRNSRQDSKKLLRDCIVRVSF